MSISTHLQQVQGTPSSVTVHQSIKGQGYVGHDSDDLCTIYKKKKHGSRWAVGERRATQSGLKVTRRDEEQSERGEVNGNKRQGLTKKFMVRAHNQGVVMEDRDIGVKIGWCYCAETGLSWQLQEERGDSCP